MKRRLSRVVILVALSLSVAFGTAAKSSSSPPSNSIAHRSTARPNTTFFSPETMPSRPTVTRSSISCTV